MDRFGLEEEEVVFYGAELVREFPGLTSLILNHVLQISTLERMHAAGILHRDLKPSNILIDKNGHLVIADFGLARMLAVDEQVTDQPWGTPGYTAPEVFTKGTYSWGADVWSLGIVLYEMAFKCKPWDGTDADDIWRRTLEHPDRFFDKILTVQHLDALIMVSLLLRDLCSCTKPTTISRPCRRPIAGSAYRNSNKENSSGPCKSYIVIKTAFVDD
jgi:serine/threonine protein kinase